MRQTLSFYHGTWVHKYNGKLGLSAIKHGPWEILSRVVMVAGECGWISRTAHVREKPCRRYLTQLPIKAIPVPNASRRRHVGVKCLRNRNWNRLQLHHKIHYMSSNWKPFRREIRRRTFMSSSIFDSSKFNVLQLLLLNDDDDEEQE